MENEPHQHASWHLAHSVVATVVEPCPQAFSCVLTQSLHPVLCSLDNDDEFDQEADDIKYFGVSLGKS